MPILTFLLHHIPPFPVIILILSFCCVRPIQCALPASVIGGRMFLPEHMTS